MQSLFVRTSKTGSTSLHEWSRRRGSLSTDNKFYLSDDKNKQIIKDINSFEVVYTLVRNPFTRAISCWQESIRQNWIKRITFKEYLNMDFYKEMPNTHAITHNIPLADYLEELLPNIHHIVKLENYKPTLDKIFEKHKDRETNISKQNTGSYDHSKIKEYLTEDIQKMIISKYGVDFEVLEYSKSIDF